MPHPFIINLMSQLRPDRNGAALVEYSLLLALIAFACIASAQLLGTQISATFSNLASSLVAVGL
jgi:Flp pilus assembly pilin Flp